MTPTVETRLAEHGSQIESLRTDYAELRDDLAAGVLRVEKRLDRLLFGILGVLATSLVGVLIALLKHG